jgi:hypothetical protein
MALYKYRVWCNTDSKYEYIWLEDTEAAPTTCPTDTNHVIDSAKTSVETVTATTQVEVVKETFLPAFLNKVLPDGKKLFRRKHGYTANIAGSSNGAIDMVVPYNTAKIAEVEIIGCQKGDKVDFKVYDDPSGTISTVPNLMLNQFGFGVWLTDNMYSDVSQYDADVILNMKIEVTYYNNDASAKDVYVNIVYHEVV